MHQMKKERKRIHPYETKLTILYPGINIKKKRVKFDKHILLIFSKLFLKIVSCLYLPEYFCIMLNEI